MAHVFNSAQEDRKTASGIVRRKGHTNLAKTEKSSCAGILVVERTEISSFEGYSSDRVRVVLGEGPETQSTDFNVLPSIEGLRTARIDIQRSPLEQRVRVSFILKYYFSTRDAQTHAKNAGSRREGY